MVSKRSIGILLIIVSLIQLSLFIGLVSETKDALLAKIINETEGICEHIGDQCPHEQVSGLNIFVIFGYIIIFLVLFSGILLIAPKKTKKIEYKVPKNLSEEEKKIIDLIKEKEGSIFQSELVEKTGFSKVKVTRILDSLEGKKVIERKRRGMTNIILYRYNPETSFNTN